MDIFFALDKTDPKERIQAFIDGYHNPEYQGFDGPLMRALSVVSAYGAQSSSQSRQHIASATFTLDVTPQFLNPRGAMHGGAVALLVDMCTTLAAAPIAREDFWHFGGVSRTMSITYLKPIEGGTRIVIESEVRGIGKRLLTITCAIKDEKGTVLALGEHGKAALDTKPAKLKSNI
ncbi:HotDog domain-containing protein [Halenospora varia]|nr:HotDog domain-containing protein [Halenospora varia]